MAEIIPQNYDLCRLCGATTCLVNGISKSFDGQIGYLGKTVGGREITKSDVLKGLYDLIENAKLCIKPQEQKNAIAYIYKRIAEVEKYK